MHIKDGTSKDIKAKAVGEAAWDQFIAEATHPNPFAQWRHLNAVCNRFWLMGWHILAGNLKGEVTHDTSTWDWAMPIPERTGGLLTGYVQPLFTQQLGILFRAGLGVEAERNILIEVIRQMANPNNVLSFCHANLVLLLPPEGLADIGIRFTIRPNYVLNLNQGYDQIRAGYSQNLIRKLKKPLRLHHIITYNTAEVSWQSVIRLFDTEINKGNKILSRLQISMLKDVCKAWKGQLITSMAHDTEGNLLAGIIYLCYYPIDSAPAQGNRYVAFMGGASAAGKKLDSQVLLMDANIRNWAEAGGGIYDFEGSKLPGVEAIIKTFGPEYQPYFLI